TGRPAAEKLRMGVRRFPNPGLRFGKGGGGLTSGHPANLKHTKPITHLPPMPYLSAHSTSPDPASSFSSGTDSHAVGCWSQKRSRRPKTSPKRNNMQDEIEIHLHV